MVEVTCSNRPDGAIGVFPASSSETATIYDCAHAELAGYRCSLSKPAAAYDKLTAELRVLRQEELHGLQRAQRRGSRPTAVATPRSRCADGLQGYMIEYTVKPIAMKTVIVCSEAKGIAGGCTLPGKHQEELRERTRLRVSGDGSSSEHDHVVSGGSANSRAMSSRGAPGPGSG